jgi:hypothetical protein
MEQDNSFRKAKKQQSWAVTASRTRKGRHKLGKVGMANPNIQPTHGLQPYINPPLLHSPEFCLQILYHTLLFFVLLALCLEC